MTTFDSLKSVIDQRGAAFVVLLDPDKLSNGDVHRRLDRCMRAGADAFFIGGSLLHASEVDSFVREVKKVTSLPVIGFPGSISQISPALDAVLYLSVVSGRNPDFLFGQHVYAAPMLKRMNMETIATAYMLVESGKLTTAQYMNHSLPLPRSKPEVAAATALAAEMMGMKLLYTDGGSGADQPVTVDMIKAITECCESPLVVGGGLRRPSEIRERVEAGASIIVVGNAIEEQDDVSYMEDLARAVHVNVSTHF